MAKPGFRSKQSGSGALSLNNCAIVNERFWVRSVVESVLSKLMLDLLNRRDCLAVH